MRAWLCLGAASGGIAVVMGALAAHGAGVGLSPEAARWIATGADYQMPHALALLAVAWLSGRPGAPRGGWLAAAGWAFVAGTLLFSMGLYVMAVAGLASLGPVIPVGGVAYLMGWTCLFVHALAPASASPEA